jgi:hypothetical protein
MSEEEARRYGDGGIKGVVHGSSVPLVLAFSVAALYKGGARGCSIQEQSMGSAIDNR